MNIRKITSLTAFFSFILELITSVILYIIPHGRVAYWSDWHLWGLSKSEWGALHVNLGVLLILAIIMHTYYNWPLIVKYLKSRKKHYNNSTQTTGVTANFSIALLITIAFSIGTYLNLAPFSSIINLGETLKDKAAETYGEPPYGHAELSSLKILCKRIGIDPDKSFIKLRNANIEVNNTNQTILEIAKANNLSPKEVYMVIAPTVQTSSDNKTLPPSPSGGFGKKTLKEICQTYNLNCEQILERFKTNGLPASIDMSLKDIGLKYQRNPHDLYDLLRNCETGTGVCE